MKTKGTRLLCVHSGQVSQIQRRKGRLRAQGHMKKLYCIHCKREHNHYELGEWDDVDFVLEEARIDGFDEYEFPEEELEKEELDGRCIS